MPNYDEEVDYIFPKHPEGCYEDMDIITIPDISDEEFVELEEEFV